MSKLYTAAIFVDGALLIYREDQSYNGVFVSTKEQLRSELIKRSSPLDGQYIANVMKLVFVDHKGFERPQIANVVQELDSHETLYLMKRYQLFNEFVKQPVPTGRPVIDRMTIDAKDDPRLIEFEVFGSSFAPYVSIGVLFPNGESQLALLTTVDDAVAVIEASSIELTYDILERLHIAQDRGLPKHRANTQQLFFYGELPRVVNTAALFAQAKARN